MQAIITILKTKVEQGKRIVEGLLYGKTDARTPVYTAPFGIDSNPTPGKRAVYTTTSTIGKYYIISVINTDVKAEVGETRLFSTTEQGAFKYNLWLRNSGELLMGTSTEPSEYTNFMVKFNELKTEFNSLKSTVNANALVFNSHVHVLTLSAGTGTAAVSVTQEQSSSANIDNAKNDKIKTNG